MKAKHINKIQFSNKCTSCLLPKKLCSCSLDKKKVELPLRLIFIMNKSEYFKLSNTARIFLLNSYPCEVRLRGFKEAPLSYESFSESLGDCPNYLLYPCKGAKELSLEEITQNKKSSLIIPDGNWSQGAKIAHKLNSQKNIIPVSLKMPPQSEYKLRNNPNTDRVSTFEATFHAIKKGLQLEDQERLKKAFQTLNSHILALRGKIPRKPS